VYDRTGKVNMEDRELAREIAADDYATISDTAMRPAWQRKAACGGKGTDRWFPTTREADEAARAVCEPCSVRRECFAYAMANRELVGIWAGTDATERRRLRRVSA
jgi:WhiB family redox-sensing transcriptional regulator